MIRPRKARSGGRQRPWISLPQVAAALATGKTPNLEPMPREADLQAAGILFVYPETSGRITSLRTTADPADHGWLQRFVWIRKVGDDVRQPPHSELADRIAHFIVTGPDAATRQARLDEMTRSITVETVQPALVDA